METPIHGDGRVCIDDLDGAEEDVSDDFVLNLCDEGDERVRLVTQLRDEVGFVGPVEGAQIDVPDGVAVSGGFGVNGHLRREREK